MSAACSAVPWAPASPVGYKGLTTTTLHPHPKAVRDDAYSRYSALMTRSVSRGRSNTNERGSSYDRRARRAWLVSPVAGFGGDGVKVPCWECGVWLTVDEVIPDRMVSGELGGTYRRSNIRGPHCHPCSCRQGQRRTLELWVARRDADPYDATDHCRTCRAHFLGQHGVGCPTPAIDQGAVFPGVT